MNNITPKAGQAWQHVNNDDGDLDTIERIDGDKNKVIYWSDGTSTPISTDNWRQHFTFIPQNDLEWLAVNVDEWYFSAKFMYKHDDTAYITGGERCHDRNTYNRQQWQNMRYELGLDDINELMAGIAQKVASAVAEELNIPLKKDTKMIDLSTAVVGDKFMTTASEVTLVIKGHVSNCLQYKDGSLMLARDDGSLIDSGSPLVSKVDPRHWLKDLPDADLFGSNWLACDESGVWYGFSCDPSIDDGDDEFSSNGNSYSHKGIKMPKLTGDEWRDSKISIDELRAWQVANKRAQGGPIKPGTAYRVGECGGPDVPVPNGPIVK